MFGTRSTTKRRLAAAFQPRPGPTPDSGALEVRWASAFDRACFLVTTPNLSVRYQGPYEHLMRDLTNATGCTEEEILTHGQKVRRMLQIAEGRLRQNGGLQAGRQKQAFDLAAVTPSF